MKFRLSLPALLASLALCASLLPGVRAAGLQPAPTPPIPVAAAPNLPTVPSLSPPPASSSAASAPEDAGGSAQVLDRIVAVVNDGVILQSALVQDIALAQAQMREHGIQPPSADALQSQVLEHMIKTRVQVQRARDDGIKVDDAELNETLDRIAQQNKMTPEQFEQTVTRQGINWAEIRRQVRDEIIIQKVRQKEVDQRIDITDQDVDLYLANQAEGDNYEYRLSHILISVPDNADEKARAKAEAKAETIDGKLHAGANFAQLAIANSDGQQALQGGDLGWRKGDDLPTIFANVVPTMEVGQVSDVIKALNGYHIIKLVARRATGKREKVVESHAERLLLEPNALRDDDATRALAEKLYKEIENGQDFAELARKYSDDYQSKNRGGDLGWQPPGLLPPALQSEIDKLQPDQVVPPFKTAKGWVIAKLLGRREVDVTDKMRRAQAMMAIMQRRDEENYQSWLSHLRASAYVDIRLKPGMITQAEVDAAAPHEVASAAPP